MATWLETSLFWVTQIVMLLGLIGLVVPIYPGLVIMWFGGLGYGVIRGFSLLGWVVFALMTVLMLVGTVIDNVLMGAGAKKSGASWTGIGVALLAGLVGTLLFPPLGGIIAAPLAVLVYEYFRQKDWQKAWAALRGLALGWGLSFLARFLIGLGMMGLWWLWVWKG
ncbi:MAG: hypothetical protein DDG59_11600 [Anaerolineae bacterium]|nr:MAG: hypothetical protein DDG59_11600 [Anaerolineae bacterium]